MSDSSYGIENDQPNIMFDREGILRAYQGIERHLKGQHLSRIWTVWSEQDDNIWDHAPIILEFGGFSHEMHWIKVEDLEISANTIDTSKDFNLYNFDKYACHWRENALPELQPVVGQRLLSIDLLEAEAEVSSSKGVTNRFWVSHGIIFMFDGAALCIYNAFDSNGMTTSIPTGEEYRRIAVW